MVSEGLRRATGLSATVVVDGRECTARSVAGGGPADVTGVAVIATTAPCVQDALDWMPGRILVLADAALSGECLKAVARSTHLSTFAAIVVLGEDPVDVEPLACAGSAPVVIVSRLSDQARIRRAVRLGVRVGQGSPETADLHVAHPPRPRRGGSSSIILDVPGTVGH